MVIFIARNIFWRIRFYSTVLSNSREASGGVYGSIKFTLKYIVGLSGVSYAKNYDIRARLNILRELNLQIPREKDLRNMASTINSWEAESRYNDDFCALVEDIEDTFIIADEIIAYAETPVQEAESSSSI